MSADPLIIVAKNCALPDDPEENETCRQALTSALTDVFADYDASPDRFTLFDGHLYSQVELCCPDCGDPLSLRQFGPGPENGADGLAQCACGFEGRAVYRLIDLERNLDVSTVEAMFETGSCVAEDELPVSYTPYASSEQYFL